MLHTQRRKVRFQRAAKGMIEITIGWSARSRLTVKEKRVQLTGGTTLYWSGAIWGTIFE